VGSGVVCGSLTVDDDGTDVTDEAVAGVATTAEIFDDERRED
jgi:hypothetical protein